MSKTTGRAIGAAAVGRRANSGAAGTWTDFAIAENWQIGHAPESWPLASSSADRAGSQLDGTRCRSLEVGRWCAQQACVGPSCAEEDAPEKGRAERSRSRCSAPSPAAAQRNAPAVSQTTHRRTIKDMRNRVGHGATRRCDSRPKAGREPHAACRSIAPRSDRFYLTQPGKPLQPRARTTLQWGEFAFPASFDAVSLKTRQARFEQVGPAAAQPPDLLGLFVAVVALAVGIHIHPGDQPFPVAVG